MYLPDINFWLALNFSQHKHNSAATSWFNALPQNDQCFFCRFTQMGFLRLATNPKAIRFRRKP
jgi:predicted nucleic acid-binding protein